MQYVVPNYGFTWWLERSTVVSQLTVPHGTEAAANGYHDFLEQMLREHPDQIVADNGVMVIHDWRALVSYDANARRIWQERMRVRRKGYLRGTVVCMAKRDPILQVAVQAAALAASVLHGAKVEFSTDLEGTLRAHGVQPPSAAA